MNQMGTIEQARQEGRIQQIENFKGEFEAIIWGEPDDELKVITGRYVGGVYGGRFTRINFNAAVFAYPIIEILLDDGWRALIEGRCTDMSDEDVRKAAIELSKKPINWGIE